MPTAEKLVKLTIQQWGRAATLVDPARFQAWEDQGLTMSQLRVLLNLSRDPGMSAGTLADRLGVRPSTATGIVDRLVRQDLVTRETDENDRRVVRNQLTARGAAIISDFAEGLQSYLHPIFAALSEEELRVVYNASVLLGDKAETLGLMAPSRTPQPTIEMT